MLFMLLFCCVWDTWWYNIPVCVKQSIVFDGTETCWCDVLSMLCVEDSSAGDADTKYSWRLNQSNKKYNER